MNASDVSFERIKAVQRSAEILRDTGTAFFPLNVQKFLAPFQKQIIFVTYEAARTVKTAQNDTQPMPPVQPVWMSRDGFCTRIRDVVLKTENGEKNSTIWYVYYDDRRLEARIRFTLTHELGHIFLGHHQEFDMDTLVGMEDDPDYKAADAQADAFSINLLAPAPAVFRLLKEHGFSFVQGRIGEWQLTNPNAPFLQNLGDPPDAETLVMTAFGLSQIAAHRRLMELPAEMELWEALPSDLYAGMEAIPHRAGWYCWACHTRRRTNSLYCPGCGSHHRYEYKDFGRFPRPAIGLRENGRFLFCSVCGNSDFPEDAKYCPICGSPVINECENAYYTEGDFVRRGMWVVRGTHFCKPSDIYCGKCGTVTTFGRQHGPKENYWSNSPTSDRCRTVSTSYPAVIESENGRLLSCPACGSKRTMREGRYCADCMQPLQNVCTSSGKGNSHACGANDRYCPTCGAETIFFHGGFLPGHRETDVFRLLLEREKPRKKHPQIYIRQNGEISAPQQEA